MEWNLMTFVIFTAVTSLALSYALVGPQTQGASDSLLNNAAWLAD